MSTKTDTPAAPRLTDEELALAVDAQLQCSKRGCRDCSLKDEPCEDFINAALQQLHAEHLARRAAAPADELGPWMLSAATLVAARMVAVGEDRLNEWLLSIDGVIDSMPHCEQVAVAARHYARALRDAAMGEAAQQKGAK